MTENKSLIETIKILNGEVLNWEWHLWRMEESRRVLGIVGDLPPNPLKGEHGFSLTSEDKENPCSPFRGLGGNLSKCRITYSKTIENIEFFPYKIKSIQSLKIIQDNEIDYSLKYKNRTRLNILHQQKGAADEVLMIKNGLVTDTTYANVVFEKDGQFFTPDSPLLKGTKRALLLENKIIQEIRITENDIPTFEKIHLINAMMELGECVIDCRNVF